MNDKIFDLIKLFHLMTRESIIERGIVIIPKGRKCSTLNNTKIYWSFGLKKLW